MFYNYIYLDPRKPGKYGYESICLLYEPIYVGKGKDKRCYEHLKNTSRIPNPIFRDKLNFLKKSHNMRDFIIKFNFTFDESYSYLLESSLIKEIGSTLIPSIKNGPLINICLDNRPPSLKGRTYKDIYGDNYQYQIENRRKIQLDRGGYFSGKKHTKESRDKISASISGDKNHMFGKKHNQNSIKKISEMAKIRFKNGFKNPRSKKYIATSPDGVETEIFGELKNFCIANNISYSALKKTLKTGRPVLHGKTKDWILRECD